MTGEFDAFRDTYEQELDRAVAFAGQEGRFFTEVKADALVDVAGRHLGDPARLKALDVGCGVGLTDTALRGRFGELHGVDVSEGVLEAAERANPAVDYRLGDGTKLPYGDAEFDVAFAICVMHHVPPGERRAFASELARVVRPGGLAVLFEHNPLNPLTRLVVNRCAFDENAVLLGRREAERLMDASGLTLAESRYILFFPWDAPVARAAERVLATVPFGAQYYVAAAR